MTEKFILLVEMASKHLRRLIYSMLNLDRYTSPSLRLFDNLRDSQSQSACCLTSYVRPGSCGLFPVMFYKNKVRGTIKQEMV